jgi:hypothetical protein
MHEMSAAGTSRGPLAPRYRPRDGQLGIDVVIAAQKKLGFPLYHCFLLETNILNLRKLHHKTKANSVIVYRNINRVLGDCGVL